MSNQAGKEKEMDGKRRKIVSFFVIAAVLGFLLGGCASNGTLAAQKISAGEKAINDAKVGNASLNAPAELDRAEGKMVQAREALAKKEYETAARLAEQASIDAEYARTKAATAKTQNTVIEMRKNIDALRQEIERLSQK
jgi:septal ring factor EnvC (AmiA/AmiB activator)